MKNRSPLEDSSQLSKLMNDHGLAGSGSAGQSGDVQGLSQRTTAAEESVEELAETDQDYEAEVEIGVEDAADHPERPVPIRRSWVLHTKGLTGRRHQGRCCA